MASTGGSQQNERIAVLSSEGWELPEVPDLQLL